MLLAHNLHIQYTITIAYDTATGNYSLTLYLPPLMGPVESITVAPAALDSQCRRLAHEGLDRLLEARLEEEDRRG